MKYIIYISILLILLSSCIKKDTNPFFIQLPHYSSRIKIDGLKDFDTLISWDWYNDNMMSDRRCYRIQNSKLGIVMENGVLPKYADHYKHMTIKVPIAPNKFGYTSIKDWLHQVKSMYSEEHPAYKFSIIDSIIIDNHKFGILSIERDWIDEYRIRNLFMTNINNEEIVFDFYTNLPMQDSFYVKSLNMMKTIEIKPLTEK